MKASAILLLDESGGVLGRAGNFPEWLPENELVCRLGQALCLNRVIAGLCGEQQVTGSGQAPTQIWSMQADKSWLTLGSIWPGKGLLFVTPAPFAPAGLEAVLRAAGQPLERIRMNPPRSLQETETGAAPVSDTLHTVPTAARKTAQEKGGSAPVPAEYLVEKGPPEDLSNLEAAFKAARRAPQMDVDAFWESAVDEMEES
jgi:hypothetical protein